MTEFLSDTLCSKLNVSDDNPSDVSERISLSTLEIPEWLLSAYISVGINAPTSAGKTFVAEIIMLNRITYQLPGQKALFVVPFVSTAAEKEAYFRRLLIGSNIRVGGMYGQNKRGCLKLFDIVVCTFEKANSLINNLINHSDVGDNLLKKTIGIVILDEIHMACLENEGRSATVRSLVAQLRRYGQNHVRIVAMSATIPKPAKHLKQWLNAELYETEYRPLKLKEYVYVNNKLMKFPSLEIVSEHKSSDISDLICPLVEQNQNVLVFCNSKAWCERLAQKLAANLPMAIEAATCSLSLLEASTVGKTDPLLRKVLMHKVGFHHAGLSFEERAAVESAYKSGYCTVLVATTTLCSGVNLPAKRVIIRSIVRGGKNDFIDWLLYRQMIGRAGRTGQCKFGGDSVLICANNTELYKAIELFKGSSVYTERMTLSSEQLKRLTLDAVGNDDSTKQAILCFLHDYAGIQADEKVISETIKWLSDNKFVNVTKRGLISRSQLGRASISACFSPDQTISTFQEIQSAIKDGIILDTDFHLVYLISSSGSLSTDTQWTKFLSIYGSLSPAMRRVADRVGISERHMATRLIRGHITTDEEKCSRFFNALVLHSLLLEWTVDKIADHFCLLKGQVQQIQQNAVGRSYCMAQFADALNWDSLSVLLTNLTGRIEFGCNSRDFEDLLQLELLNRDRAKVLFNAGIESIRVLAETDPSKVTRILRDGIPFGNIISARYGNSRVFTYSEAAVLLVNESQNILGINITKQQALINDISAKDIFDGFEEDALAECGIRVISSIVDNNDFIACCFISDEYALAPNEEDVYRCKCLDNFLNLIILDKSGELLNHIKSLPNRKLIQLHILNWFVGWSDDKCRISDDVKHELYRAPFTYRLYKTMMKEIVDSKALHFLINVEMKAFEILTNMVNYGIWVDKCNFDNCMYDVMTNIDGENGKLKYTKEILTKLSTLMNDKTTSGWIVHCELSIPTKTGRYCLCNPPLQNVPREFTIGVIPINPRNLFTARGKQCFISADYSHIELSVLALLTNNTFLKSLLVDNEKDPFISIVHNITGSRILTREKSKVLVYALMYGAGPHLIKEYLDSSLNEAIEFKSKFLTMCEPINEDNEGGKSYFAGRKLNSTDLNTRVQSNASEIVKIGLVNVGEMIPELDLVHFIHDELVYEVDINKVDNIATKLRNALEQEYEGVKFGVKIRFGPNWGQMKLIEG